MIDLKHDLSNTTGPLIEFESTHSDDYFMALLPHRLKSFILYDALADGNVESVYRHFKRLNSDEDQTLAFLNQIKSQWTGKAYGESHPNYKPILEKIELDVH